MTRDYNGNQLTQRSTTEARDRLRLKLMGGEMKVS